MARIVQDKSKSGKVVQMPAEVFDAAYVLTDFPNIVFCSRDDDRAAIGRQLKSDAVGVGYKADQCLCQAGLLFFGNRFPG